MDVGAGRIRARFKQSIVRRVVGEVYSHFTADDGWAMASHLALQTLLSLFPFLIVVAAIAGVIGSQRLASEVASLVFETWPKEVARPMAREAHEVLTRIHAGALTLGLLFALWFASNGIEALRLALNRAYRIVEPRAYLYRRMQSLIFVCLGAVALLSLAIFIVFGPLVWAALLDVAPWLAGAERAMRVVRFATATIILAFVLTAAHQWLPAGQRRLVDILPGIGFTLVTWIAAGAGFGFYLQRIATYRDTYAGLANVTAAIVFFYVLATLLLLGAELNAALMRLRAAARL